ncbi:hypothetical protein [Streptomyces sp. PAN_FS17]|uniref:hypothetical protein n=1 Tax=Streptomyces sp. PAN_FS17 TaxID=1855351 RepID=UPI00115FE36B|nr:hypothetical protein [Streptomyces sp. PAN_FS17]
MTDSNARGSVRQVFHDGSNREGSANPPAEFLSGSIQLFIRIGIIDQGQPMAVQIGPQVPISSLAEGKQLLLILAPVASQLAICGFIGIPVSFQLSEVRDKSSRALKFSLPGQEVRDHWALHCLLYVALPAVSLI